MVIEEVFTYESIAGRWCKDHEHCQRPFDDVRTHGGSEGPGTNPEVWEWEGSLSIEQSVGKSFSNTESVGRHIPAALSKQS